MSPVERHHRQAEYAGQLLEVSRVSNLLRVNPAAETAAAKPVIFTSCREKQLGVFGRQRFRKRHRFLQRLVGKLRGGWSVSNFLDGLDE